MATILKNEEERLRELHRANQPGMEQVRLLMEGYEPRRSKYCLVLTKKSLRVIVRILTGHCQHKISPEEVGDIYGHCMQNREESNKTAIHATGSALAQNRLRHMREHLISDAKLKCLEVGLSMYVGNRLA